MKTHERSTVRRRLGGSSTNRRYASLLRAHDALHRILAAAESDRAELEIQSLAMRAAAAVRSADYAIIEELVADLRHERLRTRALGVTTLSLASALPLAIFWSPQAIRGLEIGGAAVTVILFFVALMSVLVKDPADPDLLSWDDEPDL